MEFTPKHLHLLKKGMESEYITVGPDDYADMELLHKEGFVELGFVVPGNRHYWLTGPGRQKVVALMKEDLL